MPASTLVLPAMVPVRLSDLPPGFGPELISAAAAGFPSPAQDWAEDAINLVDLLRLDRPASFVFRISGESMIETGIRDDDLVVVDRDVTPRNGHVVIAVVEGGFVCRQLVYHAGVPHLEARNARLRYPVTVADEDVEIWGVVRTAVHDLRL